MRLLATLVTLASLLAFLAACGGKDSEEAYRDTARKAVRDAVLTLDDLPAGWSPSTIGAAALADIKLTDDCALLNSRGAEFPGAVASADEEPFAGPGDQELAGTVTAFSDIQAAEDAVQLANDLVLQCTDQVQEALKEAIGKAAVQREVDRLIGDISTSVEAGTFAKLGDETVAYKLHADVSALILDFEVNGHIIVIRQGPVTGVLLYAALGDLRADEDTIANTLAGKLATAEEALAQ